jgi:two-component system response regulator GlrR
MKTETTHPADVLLVDDDPDLLKLISLRLTSAGYRVRTADSGETALAALAVARPAAVVTDLKMPGIDGLALFDAIHRQHPTLPVIILTAHGTIPEAVSATERGVFGFLTKPFDSQELLQKVASAVSMSGGEPEPTRQAAGEWRAGIITRSPRMEDVLRQARLVAESDASVLVFGESGTGKELLARAIHRASHRATKAFVAVNCGAIPEPLLESELFGHARGAFSGAVQAHKGLFQAADGGTIFLDEIGDMPLALQVKLLRVLQEGEVRPVGATASIPVDVRVISATHRDLDAQMAAGEFREDLYYRLNVVSLKLPSLAERREDIPLLATHFLRKLAERYRKSVPTLAPDAMASLISAPWPGNVRQLLNLLEQAVALTTTSMIPATLVQGALRDDAGVLAPFEEARKQFERDYLVRLLKITGGNVTQAATLAKRNRTEFYKLLQRHRLEPAMFKEGKL